MGHNRECSNNRMQTDFGKLRLPQPLMRGDMSKISHTRCSSSQLAPDMYLSFPAPNNEHHAVTVFTDIDCTCCRRFHSFMPTYNELGITVNYVMLPRAGLNSPSYNKAASVFCSSNPTENMTLAMQGEFNQKNSCEHTITNQLQLASELGITSTPTMILPDGEIKVGFLAPTALQVVLDRK